MKPQPTSYKLPDLTTYFPRNWGASINPHYTRANSESLAWLRGFTSYPDVAQVISRVERGSAGLLCACAYPYGGFEELRTCCDFVHALFVIDEVSDWQNAPGALATGHTLVKALKDEEGDDKLGVYVMVKELRERLLKHIEEVSYRRLISFCEDYITAVSKEAEIREKNVILDLDTYTLLRRNNSAIQPCFALIGYILHADLPEEIFNNPSFVDAHLTAVDAVFWANDLYSYNMEQAMGHNSNNILTVLMEAKGLSLQEASNYVGGYFAVLIDRFAANESRLSCWSPEVNQTVAAFLSGFKSWIVGNVKWSLEGERYFSTQRDNDVRKTLTVYLDEKKVIETAVFKQ